LLAKAGTEGGGDIGDRGVVVEWHSGVAFGVAQWFARLPGVR